MSYVRVPPKDVLLVWFQLHLSLHLKSKGPLDTPPERTTHKPFKRPPTQPLKWNEVGREIDGSEEVGPAVPVLDQVDEEKDEGVEDLDVVHLCGIEGGGEEGREGRRINNHRKCYKQFTHTHHARKYAPEGK